MEDPVTSGDDGPAGALSGFRICDFTGQLAGAGATRWLASFGAEVIRIEDPVLHGRWDILRGNPPFKDDRRGVDYGGGFNNHNVEKQGITLNLRTAKGKEILRELVARSDAVTENFAKGVLERWGFGYAALRELRPDIVYVSNCGFGHVGPYSDFKTWGPIVQAVSGLTFTSGLPEQPPAGWGYSYMDHTGAYYMAMAILLALLHRQRTGEGQWIDLACTEAALTLHGPALLDWTVNGRPSRRAGEPNSNRSPWAPMAPHGVFPCAGDDEWVAIAARNDEEFAALAAYVDEPWVRAPAYATVTGRLEHQDELEHALTAWTRVRNKFLLADALQQQLAVAPVLKPGERIDDDPRTGAFGLWPEVTHSAMGTVRVDGQPVHFSESDWRMERGAPCLGEHTDAVLSRLLGYSAEDLAALRRRGCCERAGRGAGHRTRGGAHRLCGQAAGRLWRGRDSGGTARGMSDPRLRPFSR